MSPLRLNGSTSGYTTLDAPAVAGSNTLVLPTSNGSSGQVLSTNGSGALSWIGAGKILQIVSTAKTDTFSTTTQTAWTDVTGFNVSITPQSSSNKVLVIASYYCSITGASGGYYQKLVRGSTDICIGDAAGSRLRASSGTYVNSNFNGGAISSQQIVFLDSPSTTSSTTYKLQAYLIAGTHTWQFNIPYADTDSSSYARFASTITAMEVAA